MNHDIERMAGACPPPGFIDTGFTVYDVPVDPDDPTCHTNVGRRVYRTDDGDVHEPPLGLGIGSELDPMVQAAPDPDAWPMPKPPPYPADDEALEVPDE